MDKSFANRLQSVCVPFAILGKKNYEKLIFQEDYATIKESNRIRNIFPLKRYVLLLSLCHSFPIRLPFCDPIRSGFSTLISKQGLPGWNTIGISWARKSPTDRIRLLLAEKGFMLNSIHAFASVDTVNKFAILEFSTFTFAVWIGAT